MELKVWVDNIQRIVCGVSDATTCQDVVYALAHATSQTGRFTLVEKWRSNERILSPSDKPVKVLLKWGEYSGDVQFVLRRSSNSSEENKDPKSPYFSPQRHLNNSRENSKSPTLYSNKEIKKSLTFSGGRSGASTPSDVLSTPVTARAEVAPVQSVRNEPPLYKDHRLRSDLPKGVVRGVPQQKQPNVQPEVVSPEKDADPVILRSSKKIGPPPEYRRPPPCQQSSVNVRESPKRTFYPSDNHSNHTSNGVGTVAPIIYSGHKVPYSTTSLEVANVNTMLPNDMPSKKDISYYPKDHNDKLCEQSTSPVSYYKSGSINNNVNKYVPVPPERTQASHDKVYKRTQNDAQFLDLLHLVNSQREKISALDSDLKKYDSEIKFREENNKKNEQQSQIIEREIKRLEFSELEQAELIVQLDMQQMDKKFESGKKHEQSLKDEISQIRSDFRSNENNISAYQEKVELLVCTIKDEKEKLNEEKKQQEMKETELTNQVDNLKEKIKQEACKYDENLNSLDALEEEISLLAGGMEDKKKEIEELVGDMKAVNLESLTLGSTDESKPEGSSHTRSGSARKIVGSPRELENAVPTSKNPHGVWV